MYLPCATNAKIRLGHLLTKCPSPHQFWSLHKGFTKAMRTLPTGGNSGFGGRLYNTLCFGRLILRHWESENVPSIEMWMRELSESRCMEELRYKNADRLGIFEKVWEPVLKYLKELRETNVKL